MTKLVKAVAKYLGIQPWIVIAAAVVLVIASAGIAKCSYDSAVIEKHTTKANNETLRGTIEANDQAANEQLADQRDLEEIRRSYNDAIFNPPPGSDPDARVRFACERLRRFGHREADLPESCRHAGSGRGGTEADP